MTTPRFTITCSFSLIMMPNKPTSFVTMRGPTSSRRLTFTLFLSATHSPGAATSLGSSSATSFEQPTPTYLLHPDQTTLLTARQHSSLDATATMAQEHHTPDFLGLPMEVRFIIFGYVAARNDDHRKLLRYWFEKKEIEVLKAEFEANKDLQDDDDGEGTEEGYEDEYEGEGDLEGEFEEDEESEDVEQLDRDEEGNEGETENEGVEAEAQTATTTNMQPPSATYSNTASQQPDQRQSQPKDNEEQDPDTIMEDSVEDQQNLINDDEGQVAGNEEIEEDDENNDEQDDEQDAQGDEEDEQDSEGDEYDSAEEEIEGGADDSDDYDTTAPSAPTFTAHRKWRHIPKFLQISQFPPPAELLLSCKQVNNEAKDWFYDVSSIRIIATASFAHTSFFEEAFNQIAEAEFSPMQNIRKVDVLFFWDTTWLRGTADEAIMSIFPALLRQRATFIRKILAQAPDLRGVTVHWCDTAQDIDSTMFKLDIVEQFNDLSAMVKVDESYVPADYIPPKHCLVGKFRREYQRIVDDGLDRLF